MDGWANEDGFAGSPWGLLLIGALIVIDLIIIGVALAPGIRSWRAARADLPRRKECQRELRAQKELHFAKIRRVLAGEASLVEALTFDEWRWFFPESCRPS